MKAPWQKENLICYLFADALGEANSRAASAAMMKDSFPTRRINQLKEITLAYID